MTDREKYLEEKLLNNMRFTRIFGGTMLFGIIVNIVILALSDRNSCDFPPCDPYLFYLATSLFIGFFVSYLLVKIDPPNLSE